MVVSNSLFYSMMAFSLIAAFLFLSSVYLEAVRVEDEQEITRTRALAFSESVRSVSLDFPRALEVSCKRALLAASNDAAARGPFDNASLGIIELCLNETIRGATPEIMKGQSIGKWLNASIQKGAFKGYAVNASLSVEVRQLDAFTVACSSTLYLNAVDPFLKANFSRTLYAESNVSIDGYPDPAFTIKTNGVALRAINLAGKKISGTQLVDEAVLNGYYMPSAFGASFLDRLEGSIVYTGRNPGALNASGLESFVNLEDLSMQGVELKENQSIIDYYYFDSENIPGFKVENSTVEWLKLDLETMARYGVSPSP